MFKDCWIMYFAYRMTEHESGSVVTLDNSLNPSVLQSNQ